MISLNVNSSPQESCVSFGKGSIYYSMQSFSLFSCWHPLILVSLLLLFAANRTRSTESILLEDLFRYYDRDARPIKNVSDAIQIGVDIYMNKILELVSITSDSLEVILWQDSLSVWCHQYTAALMGIPRKNRDKPSNNLWFYTSRTVLLDFHIIDSIYGEYVKMFKHFYMSYPLLIEQGLQS